MAATMGWFVTMMTTVVRRDGGDGVITGGQRQEAGYRWWGEGNVKEKVSRLGILFYYLSFPF